MVNTSTLIRLNLQLFAEGAGDGGATGAEGSAAGSNEGVNADLSGVTYGKPTGMAGVAGQQNTASDDIAARFDELIKGEFKDVYNRRMQDTVQKRLKSSKETVDRYNALSPTIELLAQKYGVNADDIDGLNNAIMQDDSYYEDEAYERGITVQQLKEIRAMERENAKLRAEMQERNTRENADRLYTSWLESAESLKQVYPAFDLDTEIQNPDFAKLLQNNIDMRTAFEVVHRDDIMPAAMQYTAQTVEKKIANRVRANGMRPSENGAGSQAAALVKSNVGQLTRADREEINRRVARGERIVF